MPGSNALPESCESYCSPSGRTPRCSIAGEAAGEEVVGMFFHVLVEIQLSQFSVNPPPPNPCPAPLPQPNPLTPKPHTNNLPHKQPPHLVAIHCRLHQLGDLLKDLLLARARRKHAVKRECVALQRARAVARRRRQPHGRRQQVVRLGKVERPVADADADADTVTNAFGGVGGRERPSAAEHADVSLELQHRVVEFATDELRPRQARLSVCERRGAGVGARACGRSLGCARRRVRLGDRLVLLGGAQVLTHASDELLLSRDLQGGARSKQGQCASSGHKREQRSRSWLVPPRRWRMPKTSFGCIAACGVGEEAQRRHQVLNWIKTGTPHQALHTITSLRYKVLGCTVARLLPTKPCPSPPPALPPHAYSPPRVLPPALPALPSHLSPLELAFEASGVRQCALALRTRRLQVAAQRRDIRHGGVALRAQLTDLPGRGKGCRGDWAITAWPSHTAHSSVRVFATASSRSERGWPTCPGAAGGGTFHSLACVRHKPILTVCPFARSAALVARFDKPRVCLAEFCMYGAQNVRMCLCHCQRPGT
eukprot:358448-Chlamydomonas_euryale.AAC.3